jgi:coenzyme F420-reducing hydrogenase gamma subunit
VAAKEKATIMVAFSSCELTGPVTGSKSVALLKQAGETYIFVTFSA